jgi:DNA-binding PadR family transcriptional regulator
MVKRFESMKDFDNFRNINPPLHHGELPSGGHSPPGGPKSPFGFPTFFGSPGNFRPPLPMTLESFKEIKYFMILMILSENPDGITGYKFQEKFSIPRGNILRIMKDLVEMEYVETSETVLKGRAQKYFIITEKGKDYLTDLKKKWGERFTQMSEMADPKMMGNMFMFMRKGMETMLTHQIEKLDSKKDAIDFFRGLRSKVKTFIGQMSKRLDFLKIAKSELDSMIQTIEKNNELDLDEIKRIIEEIKAKLDEQL